MQGRVVQSLGWEFRHRATKAEPHTTETHVPTAVLRNNRNHWNEKPAQHNETAAPAHGNWRTGTATKTQSRAAINK